VNALTITLITFGCLFGGALLGLFLRTLLPQHHLSTESSDTVKLGAGIVATMAALVLGVLIGSTKTSFDDMNTEITKIGAGVIQLDHVLAHYGVESKEIREMIRGTLVTTINAIWPEEMSRTQVEAIEKSDRMETIQIRIMELTPRNDTQRLLQAQALQISNDLAQIRWMLIEQQHKSLPTVFLVVLVFWLSMLFISFGLFANGNATVITVLCISACSVSAALFLILEMNDPLQGMIKVPSAPLFKALDLIGK
jgi:hypothetical protein